MRHAPQERIVRREVAQTVVEAARDFAGALGVRVEDKRQGPPKLHDLPSLQKLCGSRFGWPAGKTLEVAQELYDGQGKKIITYPRAEVRYLPESLISDVPKIVAALQEGKSFSAIPVPDPPIIRKGASGSFHDKGLEGASHHAVIPNVNTVDNLREVWPQFFDRREETVRRDQQQVGLSSGCAHARLPLPSTDDRNARRPGIPFSRHRSPAHRSWLARGIPGVATRR